jgi:hypothetical protein
MGNERETADLQVLGEMVESSDRPVVILKARRAYHAYRDMLFYYAMKNLLVYAAGRQGAFVTDMARELGGPRIPKWYNLGGQPVAEEDLVRVIEEIRCGRLDSWEQVHRRYDALWAAYPVAKQRHAFAVLMQILGTDVLTSSLWNTALDRLVEIDRYVEDNVYASRKKDFESPFRSSVYRNEAEMAAVIGSAGENEFVLRVRAESEVLRTTVAAVRGMG